MKGDEKENRLHELLKPHDNPAHHDWFFYLPLNFNEALDIALTPRVKDKVQSLHWMQGGWFYFKAGDIIYDTPDAYEEWASKGMRFNYCIQVDSGQTATPAAKDEPRDSGLVNFSVFTPDRANTKLKTLGKFSMTQDEFVRFLITGESHPLTLGKTESELWHH